jgi:hypothetical protein
MKYLIFQFFLNFNQLLTASGDDPIASGRDRLINLFKNLTGAGTLVSFFAGVLACIYYGMLLK